MNDYRNFQRKTSRKKGVNFNKHCKGKHCIKQKNKYTAVISNKRAQVQQSRHSQRCDKFVRNSQHERYLHAQMTRGNFSCVIDHTKKKHVLSQEQLDEINDENGFEMLKCKYRLFLRDMSPTLKLNCTKYDADWSGIKTVNLLCASNQISSNPVQYGNHPPKRISHCKYNMKQDYNCKENMLTRMPHDVFLYCICDKYLYPNEIFLLLTLSKNIFKILTNKYHLNKSLLHKIISKERLIEYYLDLIDSSHDEDLNGYKTENNSLNLRFWWSTIDNAKTVMFICNSLIDWLQNWDINSSTSIVITDKMEQTIKINMALIDVDAINQLIKRVRYLFVLTVSKLIKCTHTNYSCKIGNPSDNESNDSMKISIVCDCNDTITDFFIEKFLTNRIINYLTLSNYNYCQNDDQLQCTKKRDYNYKVLQSVVEFIQLSRPFTKYNMRVYFDSNSITHWNLGNRPIVWSNHKYTFGYPIWNRYFVNLPYKLRYKNKVIKCLSLNKIFEKYDNICVGGEYYSRSDPLQLVSTLCNLKNCNCIFLIVSVQ